MVSVLFSLCKHDCFLVSCVISGVSFAHMDFVHHRWGNQAKRLTVGMLLLFFVCSLASLGEYSPLHYLVLRLLHVTRCHTVVSVDASHGPSIDATYLFLPPHSDPVHVCDVMEYVDSKPGSALIKFSPCRSCRNAWPCSNGAARTSQPRLRIFQPRIVCCSWKKTHDTNCRCSH